MITPDITFFIQLLNFIITLVVLNYLLIAPIRGIIRKRRDLASGLISDAQAFTESAEHKLDQYESALFTAREEAARTRDAQKAAALAQETAILTQAQEEAQAFLARSRKETQASVADAMQNVRARVPEFAALAATQLLGKKKRATS